MKTCKNMSKNHQSEKLRILQKSDTTFVKKS